MALPGDLREVLTHFLDELNSRLDSPHTFETVLRGEKTLTSADLGQQPETFTENKLIHPVLDITGNQYQEQPYGEAGERVVWPDFAIKNLSTDVIGENKAINRIDEAIPEIKDYLDRKSIGAEYGIVTDGITWRIFKIELGGDVTEYPEVATIDLRQALVEISREQGFIGSAGLTEVEISEEVSSFESIFENSNLDAYLTETAPQQIRSERKRDVDEFYELYIELLFGESDKHEYDTSLLDDIRPPDDASDSDIRLFAVTLVNRLLFIKFLESRGVLNDGFLRDRVEHYESHGETLAGNLYETQIKPLFYKLLNTPREQRDPKFKASGPEDDDWFTQVPYLNGGLFRENLAQESEYDVLDRTLPIVISDLIEGSELELNGGGFDPAVLGSVFEKTINHIEQEREQKDIGAYYTPNDVTDLINRRAVDPKVKDVLVDVFSEHASQTETEKSSIRSTIDEKELSAILRSIEDGSGWFGNVSAIQEAFEELGSLKVLDPACGSGHFLTSAMDEIYRVQLSLLRGLNRGEDPSQSKRFEVKKNLALTSIYGVDVDRVATEIAKLRVWLKIIEGNSWEEGFGQLPNIDVNISAGNSLIGLPIRGTVESADIWDDNLDELASLREEYKFDEDGDLEEIESSLKSLRPRLNEAYLSRYNKSLESTVETVDEWDSIIDSIDESTMYPTVESVKVQPEDGDSISDAQEERLESLGFTVYKRSARIDIQARESTLKQAGETDVLKKVSAELRGLLEDGFVFDEVRRRPLRHDLDNILGEPFHWPIEFPEVTQQNANSQSIHFDIIVGNPPYGDLLSESEELFTSTYDTASINEISAQFVERQLQLLDDTATFGNITTLRLVYQSSHEEFSDLLKDNLDPTTISCFGLRGRTGVFDNALIRVAIMTGQKAPDSGGEISTSDLILFTDENRQQRFTNIEHSPVDGLLLRDKIGGRGSDGPVLPKVGPEIKRNVLLKLKDESDTLLRNVYSREPTGDKDPVLWRSGSGGYWINPMLEEMYEADDLNPIYFESELQRDTAFLVLSSSLYYLYWITYGNQRNHSWTVMSAFPWPSEDRINQYEADCGTLANTLWRRMKGTFQKAHESRGRFVMSSLRPIIDDVDVLVGDLYGLTQEQIRYVQGYQTDVGEQSARAGDPHSDLSYNPMFDLHEVEGQKTED